MDRDTVNGLIHLLNLLETCIAESAIYSTRTPVQNIFEFEERSQTYIFLCLITITTLLGW